MHASEFSSHEISFYNYWTFLKTGIKLRNLPPAHSCGAVTFSGLCGSLSIFKIVELLLCSGGLAIYDRDGQQLFRVPLT